VKEMREAPPRGAATEEKTTNKVQNPQFTVGGEALGDLIDEALDGTRTYEGSIVKLLTGASPTAEQTSGLSDVLRSLAPIPEHEQELVRLCASTDASFVDAYGAVTAMTRGDGGDVARQVEKHLALRLSPEALRALQLVARVPGYAASYAHEMRQRPNRFSAAAGTEPATPWAGDYSWPDGRSLSYVDAIFEIVIGRSLTAAQRNIINCALLVGAQPATTPASTQVMTLMSCHHASPQEIYRGFLATFGFFHLGAVTACAEFLAEAHAANDLGPFLDKYLSEIRGSEGRRTGRIPGFGHRHYQRDPRGALLLARCAQAMPGDVMVLVERINAELLQRRNVAINMDGIAAAMTQQMGIPPYLASMFTIIGRTPSIYISATRRGASPDRADEGSLRNIRR
jgi:citrate synthase